MEIKIVYAYNAEKNNVFIGEHVCQVNPKRPGEFLFPSNYAETGPGPIPQNKNAFYNTSKAKWEIKNDYRGAEIYDTNTGRREYCVEFEIPAGYTLLPPGDNQTWNGSKWVDDPEKIKNAVNQAAKAALVGIDMQSVRAIREWLVSQSDAPQILKQHENDAKAERAKIK